MLFTCACATKTLLRFRGVSRSRRREYFIKIIIKLHKCLHKEQQGVEVLGLLRALRGGWGVYFRSIVLFKADRRGAALAGLLTLGRVPGEA